ncbi:uncharacterized protein LY89DRAFT_702322 [Mollisia scopiformis]|uniref:Uncharacterized protein n=1 Tax=Mollisia scopiformis TaxID=149040 RepID=A0A132B735_MOLSC|nr:uncharacterized protein LY89DRAFT_702322 [Mollisia scopiformis]KUJ07487.1 hypothetical protein LY89DRAFT_702322 [Mollisia scopiformis]
MTAITPATQAELLTKLSSNALGTAPPILPSGTVSLFLDGSWTSRRLDLQINDYLPYQRQRIQSSMGNQVAFVAFNLPVEWAPTSFLQGSTCIDLVGTGITQGANLTTNEKREDISSFFWREVDLLMGAIELFSDTQFNGRRSTIFLSEWPARVVFNLDEWLLESLVSSTVVLYENVDGTGIQFTNIKGWGNTKQIASLSDFCFDNKMSSFRWDSILPVKEIIQPFDQTGENASSLGLPIVLQLSEADAQTVTATTTDQFVVGLSLSVGAEFQASAFVASTKETISVSVNFSYTRTNTVTRTDTKTIALSITETVTVPPNKRYAASLRADIRQIPATHYTTTAQRWYTTQLSGSELDTTNGWYKRTEPMTVLVEGSLACNI